MNYRLLLVFFVYLAGCNSQPKIYPNTDPIVEKIDPANVFTPLSTETKKENGMDSVTALVADPPTLKIKRSQIMENFLQEMTPASPDYKKLMDLNYDGYKDYIIGYYGLSGTGLKNRIRVYMYLPASRSYEVNEQFSYLQNPTFYLKQKKITAFYIANGSGEGTQLEWIDSKWIITKEFTVDNNGPNSVWKINYPLKHTTEEIVQPYHIIPPTNILETNIK